MTAKEKERLKEAVIRNSWKIHYFHMMKDVLKDKYDVSPLVERGAYEDNVCAMDIALDFMEWNEYKTIEKAAIRKAEAMVEVFRRREGALI